MSTSPSTWMTDTFSAIQGKTLREICMPGSHDAGMSTLTWSTPLSDVCNTQTQTNSIEGQLACGSRYFDIRPALPFDGSQVLYTGHFSGDADFQLGATGQSLQDVFTEVSQFLSQAGCENEVVILEFSHYRDFSSFESFSASQMQQLVNFVTNQLSGLLYTNPAPTVVLSTVPLAELAGKVVAVFDNLPSELANSSAGVFSGNSFSSLILPTGAYNWLVYNNYSDTDDIWTMASGQETQFIDYDPGSLAPALYLVSWTMTMDFGDDINPSKTDCISDHATAANNIMLAQLSTWVDAGSITRDKLPNMIFWDWIEEPWAQTVVDFCVNLNAPTYAIAFESASDNSLWVVGPWSDIGTTSEGMLSGTSPSIAALPTGDWIVAFQANTNELFTVTNAPGTVSNLEQPMMPGTSPSIATLGDTVGDYAVAFQHAADSSLWVVGPSDQGGTTYEGMLSGTSPSIAALPSGDGWIVAFQANTSELFTVTNAPWVVSNLEQPMMPGTSPSIALLGDTGPYAVAFQYATDSSLWVVGPSGEGGTTYEGMLSGTSPSIAALPSGDGWIVAFQANTNELFTVTNAPRVVSNLGHPMMPGTSPSITVFATGDYAVAYQAPDGTTQVYLSADGSSSPLTDQAMATGTSPSIAS